MEKLLCFGIVFVEWFSLKFSFIHATSASNYSLNSNKKIGVKIVLVFNYGNSVKKLKQKIVLNHVKIVKE